MTSPHSEAWAPNPRQCSLLEEVRARGAISVERLAQRLDVTMQTVRRDVQRLTEAGLLDRFNGGVSLPTPSRRHPDLAQAWQQRQAIRADAKASIARSVADAVPDGSRLVLGIGTTAEAVARALSGKRGLQVITHSLHVAQALCNLPDCEVVMPGGRVRARDGALEGAATLQWLAAQTVDIAILSAWGVGPEGELQDLDERESSAMRVVLDMPCQRWMVLDSGKFSERHPVVAGSLQEVHRVFTDALPPSPMPARMHDWGVRLTIAP